MSRSSNTLRQLLSGVALCVAGTWCGRVHAEEEFPGALFEAANMQCVPTCLMCHTVNPGTANTYTKKLGGDLNAIGGFEKGGGDVEGLKAAYATWAEANPILAAEVTRGIEPGLKEDVCGPVYGCGATFARTRAGATPVAVTGVFALLAMLWLARRRR
jgi:uncharacterized protein (TIGR03382 family)